MYRDMYSNRYYWWIAYLGPECNRRYWRIWGLGNYTDQKPGMRSICSGVVNTWLDSPAWRCGRPTVCITWFMWFHIAVLCRMSHGCHVCYVRSYKSNATRLDCSSADTARASNTATSTDSLMTTTDVSYEGWNINIWLTSVVGQVAASAGIYITRIMCRDCGNVFAPRGFTHNR